MSRNFKEIEKKAKRPKKKRERQPPGEDCGYFESWKKWTESFFYFLWIKKKTFGGKSSFKTRLFLSIALQLKWAENTVINTTENDSNDSLTPSRRRTRSNKKSFYSALEK